MSRAKLGVPRLPGVRAINALGIPIDTQRSVPTLAGRKMLIPDARELKKGAGFAGAAFYFLRTSLRRLALTRRRYSSHPGQDAADASAREVVWSGPLAMPPSSVLDQLGQFLPGVEHAGLHRCGRNTEYLRALINRLLVVVNEFDHFPMFQR